MYTETKKIVDVPCAPHEIRSGDSMLGKLLTYGPHRIGSPEEVELDRRWGGIPKKVAITITQAAIEGKTGGIEDGSFKSRELKIAAAIIDACLKGQSAEGNSRLFPEKSSLGDKLLDDDRHEIIPKDKLNRYSNNNERLKYDGSITPPSDFGSTQDFAPLKFDYPKHSVVATNGRDGQAPVIVVENKLPFWASTAQ